MTKSRIFDHHHEIWSKRKREDDGALIIDWYDPDIFGDQNFLILNHKVAKQLRDFLNREYPREIKND